MQPGYSTSIKILYHQKEYKMNGLWMNFVLKIFNSIHVIVLKCMQSKNISCLHKRSLNEQFEEEGRFIFFILRNKFGAFINLYRKSIHWNSNYFQLISYLLTNKLELIPTCFASLLLHLLCLRLMLPFSYRMFWLLLLCWLFISHLFNLWNDL